MLSEKLKTIIHHVQQQCVAFEEFQRKEIAASLKFTSSEVVSNVLANIIASANNSKK